MHIDGMYNVRRSETWAVALACSDNNSTLASTLQDQHAWHSKLSTLTMRRTITVSPGFMLCCYPFTLGALRLLGWEGIRPGGRLQRTGCGRKTDA